MFHGKTNTVMYGKVYKYHLCYACFSNAGFPQLNTGGAAAPATKPAKMKNARNLKDQVILETLYYICSTSHGCQKSDSLKQCGRQLFNMSNY